MADILCPKTGKVIRQSLTSSSGGESRYLSEFEEIKTLGTGGYGFVVLCNNKLDGKHYAMKKIPLKGTELDFDKILREVHAISSMHHQHIVRYFQAWLEPCFAVTPSTSDKLFKDWCSEDLESELNEILDSPTLYIQMEHCTRSLNDFLYSIVKGEKYDGEKAWKIFRQIVIALAHIHDKGFIHLDLTVNNIFLDQDDNVKIGDFGHAKKVDESNTVDQTNSDATELYMAPERNFTGGNAKIDIKADIFSLGILMVEVLDPLEPRDRYSIFKKLMTETEKEVQDIVFPESIKRCPKSVMQLLAKNPSKRPSADVIYKCASFQFKPDSAVLSPSHSVMNLSAKNPSKRPSAVEIYKDAAQSKPDSVPKTNSERPSADSQTAKTEWEIAPLDKNPSKRPKISSKRPHTI